MKFKLTAIVVIIVLIGIWMPGDSMPSVGIPGLDKLAHFGMFFAITGTFYLEYVMNYKKLPKAAYVILAVGLFGLSTEIMQLFASNRSCDVKDLLADMVGCIVGSGLWIYGMKWRDNQKRSKL